MTTVEVTGSVNDGWIYNTASFWATCVNSPTGISCNDSETESPECLQASFETGEYKAARVFLYFDLSSINLPKYAVITEARLKLYGYGYSTAVKIAVQEGTQGDTLSVNDYGAITGPLLGVNDFDFSSAGINAIQFNEDGVAYLNQQIGFMAKFCLREFGHDYSGAQPNDVFKSGLFFSEVSGSERKPTLEISYVDAASPVTVKGSPNDGEVNSMPETTWQANLDEPTGDGVMTDYPYMYFTDDGNDNRRYFFYFDCSDLPDGISLTNVTFSIHGTVNDPGNEGIGASLFRGTQNESLTVEDYDAFTGNVLASVDPGDGESGWFDFVLNAEGITAANEMLAETGKILKFCLRVTRFDVNRETPPGSGWSPSFEMKSSDYSDPALHPQISVEFTLPAAQAACEDGGWLWYDGVCHQNLPNSQSECENHGFYWYGGACYLDLPDNEIECAGYSYYWYYGECRLSNKLGVIPCVCIDTVEKIWLVAGHEVLEINEVFVSVTGSEEPRLRTTGFEKYPAYDYQGGLNGKIAVIQFTYDPPESNGKVWCNVKGMKNDQGILIENPVEIMKHFLGNYLSMTSSNYSETSFETAKLQAEASGHKGAGMIKDHPKGLDVIEEVARSIGATLFFDRDGRLNIKGAD